LRDVNMTFSDFRRELKTFLWFTVARVHCESMASIPVGSWGQEWTPPTFSPARVRILVDPGSIFRKYKCYMIKLALTFSDQYSFFDTKD